MPKYFYLFGGVIIGTVLSYYYNIKKSKGPTVHSIKCELDMPSFKKN
jgi:hypothetical protein